MHSTISPDCATTRWSIHDQFPRHDDAKTRVALGCPQGSPVSQVQSHVPEQVVRRADLCSLQEFERLAQRRAARRLFFQQWTLDATSKPNPKTQRQSGAWSVRDKDIIRMGVGIARAAHSRPTEETAGVRNVLTSEMRLPPAGRAAGVN
jgi:hypothetical protein